MTPALPKAVDQSGREAQAPSGGAPALPSPVRGAMGILGQLRAEWRVVGMVTRLREIRSKRPDSQWVGYMATVQGLGFGVTLDCTEELYRLLREGHLYTFRGELQRAEHEGFGEVFRLRVESYEEYQG